MQIMGGEGYMTENEFERLWRDNRIHRIVEGSNEVMQSFIFAYGGKQLAEQMIGIQEALGWDTDESIADNLNRFVRNAINPEIVRRALPLAAQLFLGLKPNAPMVMGVHPALQVYADRLGKLVQEHSHYFKMTSKWYKEAIVTRGAPQARVANNAVYLYAMSASLSKMDHLLRSGAHGIRFERDRAAFEHAFDLFELMIKGEIHAMRNNADDSMLKAAAAARRFNDTLPNTDFYIHESSPVATGKPVPTEHIQQFPGDRYMQGDGAASGTPTIETKKKRTTAKQS